MDRFQAVLIEKARTPKVRELEEEFAAEVNESGTKDDTAPSTAQGKVPSKQSFLKMHTDKNLDKGSDRHKLLRARREAKLANLVIKKAQ